MNSLECHAKELEEYLSMCTLFEDNSLRWNPRKVCIAKVY
jgi:hypothetical protein